MLHAGALNQFFLDEFTLIKQPKQKLRKRMKRGVAFLHDIAEKFRPKEPEREKPHGREMDK